MIDAICQDAQRQRLDVSFGILRAISVGEYTRQFRDFGNPPTVGFTLDLDAHLH